MGADDGLGAGLAGFLAQQIWAIYRHFPFQGYWDWLVLFLLIALGTHLSFLPYLWRCVDADMKVMQGRESGKKDAIPVQGMLPGLWGGGWMYFFLWFFYTMEGRTFLSGRTLFPGTVLNAPSAGHHQLFSGLGLFVLVAVLIAITQIGGLKRRKLGQQRRTEPFSDRGFLSLWLGGGTFADDDDGVSSSSTVSFPVLLAYVLYWYWSDASLALMLCFVFAAMVADGCRMLFVYVLHSRYFG